MSLERKSKFKPTEIGSIPADWNVAKLGEVSERIFTGRDPTGGKLAHSKESTEYRLIRSAEVFDGFLKSDEISHIDQITAELLKSAEVTEDDVLLNQLGDGITFARSCVVPAIECRAFVTRSIGVIKTNKNVLNPHFLNAYLVLPKTKQYIESFNSGSSRRAIDGGKMKQFLIPLPSMSEQNLIAKFHDNVRSRIELLKEQNKVIETISQSIFKRWFVDFEFPNEEGKPYKSSAGEMVLNEEIGREIPKGWLVEKIGDLCSSITNGGTPKRMESKYWNGKIPWFKTGELTDGPLIDSEEHITEEGLKNSAANLWCENTILIALYAAPTVGRLGLLRTKAASNQACSGLVAKKEIGYSFLFHTLFFKRNEFNNIAVGAAQQNIGQQIVREAKAVIPPATLLSKFNDLSDLFFDKQTEAVLQIRTLSQMRDDLLPKLVSGRIRVPVSKESMVLHDV